MNVREWMNQRPGLLVAITAVVVVGIVAEAYHLLKAPTGPALDRSKVGTTMVFYTADDGATLFTGLDEQAAPRDPDGRPGVKAYVFACNGKHFVQCLEKYSNGPGSGLLVKRPGEAEWVPASSPAAAAIRHPACPDGRTPSPVLATD